MKNLNIFGVIYRIIRLLNVKTINITKYFYVLENNYNLIVLALSFINCLITFSHLKKREREETII